MLRIVYDDNLNEVMDKVNAALESHGLEFVAEEPESDDTPWIDYRIACVGQRACIKRAMARSQETQDITV